MKTNRKRLNCINDPAEFAEVTREVIRGIEDINEDTQFRLAFEVHTKDNSMRLFADSLYTSFSDMMIGFSDEVETIQHGRGMLCIGNELFVEDTNIRAVTLKCYYRHRDGACWTLISPLVFHKMLQLANYRYEGGSRSPIMVKSMLKTRSEKEDCHGQEEG